MTGSAQVSVAIADTTFALTHFNGSPLPVLVAADTVLFNGVPEFAEVYAESGTLVLSGLMQLRYSLDVRFSQYRVVCTGNTVTRELRLQTREFDRGIVTAVTDGNLSMLSELIGPRLEHTAALQPDGFLGTSGFRVTMRFSTCSIGDRRRSAAITVLSSTAPRSSSLRRPAPISR